MHLTNHRRLSALLPGEQERAIAALASLAERLKRASSRCSAAGRSSRRRSCATESGVNDLTHV